jgi:hypothetical protein
MKLPNAQFAIIEERKIVDYLLNRNHPENGGKADFFLAIGFTPIHWDVLAGAFREMALTSEVSNHVQSSHGEKYVVEDGIMPPSGRRVFVRTIWIIDRGETVPRLVTAYPQP